MDLRIDAAVRDARHGDPRAFRILVEQLAPDVVRFSTLFLRGDAHAANDVTQETFLRAWDVMERFADADHLRRWCFRVARCKAVSWLRRTQPRHRRVLSIDAEGGALLLPPAPGLPGDAAAPAPSSGPWGVAERARAGEGTDAARLDALRDAIARLPTSYAGCVYLHHLQGRPIAEVARLLGLPGSTIKMRLHRARRFLRQEIERALEGPDAGEAPTPDAPRRARAPSAPEGRSP